MQLQALGGGGAGDPSGLQNVSQRIARAPPTLSLALLRVIAAAQGVIKPMAPAVLARLTPILLVIATRPSNPQFNHYLFESISAIVRYGADATPASVASFEQALFPAFQKILQDDITGAPRLLAGCRRGYEAGPR